MAAHSRKQQRPYPDFPLTPRDDGRWCKRILGRLHIFTGDWETAKKEYDRVKDALHAGRKPEPKADGNALTTAGLVNHWLTHKQSRVDSDENAPRTFAEYHDAAGALIDSFGRERAVADLKPQDFQRLRAAMAKRWGPSRLKNKIQTIRSMFVYGYEMGLMDRSVRFGPVFEKPPQSVIRKSKQPREFSAEQIKALLEIASPNMKAATLLGINGGMGAADLAALPLEVIVLDSGWIDYPRVKTGVERRTPLWPETVKAGAEVLRHRRQPKDEQDARFRFIGQSGRAYMRDRTSMAGKQIVRHKKSDMMSHEFSRLLKGAGLTGRAHYDLRRTFQGIAENCNDAVAVSAIMGHAPGSGDMSSAYRQRTDDSRLLAAVNAVRLWLFPPEQAKTKPAKRQER